MIERDVKKSLREYLTKIGAYQYWPVPMGYGAKTVDCLFCYKGVFYAVECKRPEINKATPAQAQVLFEVGEAGGGWCVENNPALTAVRAMLAGHKDLRERNDKERDQSVDWRRPETGVAAR